MKYTSLIKKIGLFSGATAGFVTSASIVALFNHIGSHIQGYEWVNATDLLKVVSTIGVLGGVTGGVAGLYVANQLVKEIYELPKLVASRVEKTLSNKSKYNFVVNRFAKTLANKTESVLCNTLERVDCKEVKNPGPSQLSTVCFFQIKKRVKLKLADVVHQKASKMIDEKLNLINKQRYLPKCGKKIFHTQATLFLKNKVLPILTEEVPHIKLDMK